MNNNQPAIHIKQVCNRDFKSHIVIRSLESLKALLAFAYKPNLQYSDMAVLVRLKNETSFSIDLQEVLHSDNLVIEITSELNVLFRDANSNALLFQFMSNTNTLVEYDYTIANGAGDSSYKIEPHQVSEDFDQKEADKIFKTLTNNIVAVENSHHDVDHVLKNRFPELVTLIFNQ